MGTKVTTEEFIERAIAVHGNKYDYSMTVYTKASDNVRVICPRHGPFVIRASNHTHQGKGCQVCAFGGNAEERFWAKVNKDGPQLEHMDSPCWEWTGSLPADGYGRFGISHGNIVLAHVFSYELTRGPIERDSRGRRRFWVLHVCDNRKCCNPSHLFLGDDHDNMQDAAKKGRLPHKVTPKEVKEIRELHESGGYTMVDLSKMFGISPGTIRQIVTKFTWKHVG